MSHRSTSYDLYKSPRRSRAYSSAFDDTPSILRSSYRGGQSPGRRVEIKEPRSFYRDHEASMTAPDLYGKYYDDSSSKLKLDVLELENKLKQRDLKLAELERQLGDYQDIENHQAKTVRQLQERIETLQRDYTANATAASRGEITISSLQNDNRLLQDRLQEVETRLRRQMEERDEMSSTATEYERNYEDLKRIINATIITDGYGIESSRSHDSVRRKLPVSRVT
uniref:Paramyosin n=1 Tax=Plectus sambesii TaxID=2011161 RepID=A0A914WSS4_9BILA